MKYDHLMCVYLTNGRVTEIYGKDTTDSDNSDRSGRGNKRIPHGVLSEVGKVKEERDRPDQGAE